MSEDNTKIETVVIPSALYWAWAEETYTAEQLASLIALVRKAVDGHPEVSIRDRITRVKLAVADGRNSRRWLIDDATACLLLHDADRLDSRGPSHETEAAP